jgi:hypothetical protein
LSKKPFQKELAMHRLTFDPRQCRVLLLVNNKNFGERGRITQMRERGGGGETDRQTDFGKRKEIQIC